MELYKNENGVITLIDNGITIMRFTGYFTMEDVVEFIKVYTGA